MPGVLDVCGLIEDSHCGYCQGSTKTSLGEGEAETGRSCSFGLWAHNLTALQYQDLIDCGWRRSGNYLYKPIMDKTCCPQYTIRLDSHKFFLSKNQRRVLRTMHEYLKNDVRPRSGPIREVDESNSTKKNEKNDVEGSKPVVKKPIKGQSQKKKEKRRERCIQKWISKGLDVNKMKEERRLKEESRRRTIESYLILPDSTWKHTLEVKLVSTRGEEVKEREEESFKLYQKYQSIIHNDTDCQKRGYTRFLCSDPFEDHEVTLSSDPRVPYGAYHQWYLLDGKLIAVGVVDILPRCVSSKYMFYDPDYNFLSIGTYTALREIEFTKRLSVERPGLRYYYMGYYIHSCPKMRYKGKFQPSDLLCDKSLTWVPLSECVKKMDNSTTSFVVLCPDLVAPRKSITDLVVIANRQAIRYANLPLYIENYTVREPAKVKESLTLLASLLPLISLRENLYFFVADIHRLVAAKTNNEDSDDSS